MRRRTLVLLAAAWLGLAAAPALADTIKVGVIGTFSGPFSTFGKNFRWGIEAWQLAHGKTVAGHTVEFVYRDEETFDPAKARALALDLVVKEKVQYLAGAALTPNALAIATVLEQGKVPFVIFNAATSAITEKSPWIVRTSMTLWQNTVPAAKVARAEGARTAVIAVSDYGPGIDAEAAFKTTFEKAGGTIADTIRMPVRTTDFGPFMQRVKDSKAEAVFAFLPSGPPTLAFVKAFIDNGLKAQGVKLVTTGDLTSEPDLPAIGDAGLGIVSTFHYSVAHPSAANRAFLAELKRAGAPDGEIMMAAVGAYDGARVIYRMIEATGGAQDPEKAVASVKGFSFESPRGPVTIDPETRHARQTIYKRIVEKDGATYVNREVESFPDQPDWGLMQGTR